MYLDHSFPRETSHVKENNIPVLFAIGQSSFYTAEEAKAAGVETYWFEDKESAAKALVDFLKTGDTILVKASHGVYLESVIEEIYKKWKKEA